MISVHTSVSSLFYVHNIFWICASVHGFVRTTDLVLNEGTTQEVIAMILDVKGNTLVEPASTQVRNFGFSFTCIYSSNGGGPQAVGELWMCVGKDTTFMCRVIQACLHKVGFLAFKLASCSISVYSWSVCSSNNNFKDEVDWTGLDSQKRQK